MPYGLSQEELESIIKALASEKKVTQAILFGSRAKGNFRTGSDIDIALKGENLGLSELNSLYAALDELPLIYKFDLVIFNRITEAALVEHIERVGVVIL
jgi:predicted nucleotidyltransferase